MAFIRNPPNFKTKNVSWLDENCSAALDEKQETHREYRKNPNANRLRHCRVQQRSLKASLERCQEQNHQTLFEFLKSTKDFWKFISNIRKPMKCSDIDKLKSSFGDTITDHCPIAKFLLYKFATLGNSNSPNRYRHEEQIESPPIATTPIRFDFLYVTSKELLDTIRQLNGIKPWGPSQIPVRTLRDSALCIHIPLSFIKNNAFKTQMFPNGLKKAKITPIFNKCEEIDPISYQPVSITPAPANVFERLMKIRMVDYLERKKILLLRQFGCRTTRSTKVAVLYVNDKIRYTISSSLYTVCAALDLFRAFDSISHTFMCENLEHIGFSMNACSFIKEFLMNRINVYVLMEPDQTGSVSSKECLKDQNSGPSFFYYTLMTWPKTVIQTLK